MLSVLELPLFIEERVCGVEISDLLCLASGNNSNLTSEDMGNLLRNGIAADGDNDPAPQNIPVPGTFP